MGIRLPGSGCASAHTVGSTHPVGESEGARRLHCPCFPDCKWLDGEVTQGPAMLA